MRLFACLVVIVLLIKNSSTRPGAISGNLIKDKIGNLLDRLEVFKPKENVDANSHARSNAQSLGGGLNIGPVAINGGFSFLSASSSAHNGGSASAVTKNAAIRNNGYGDSNANAQASANAQVDSYGNDGVQGLNHNSLLSGAVESNDNANANAQANTKENNGDVLEKHSNHGEYQQSSNYPSKPVGENNPNLDSALSGAGNANANSNVNVNANTNANTGAVKQAPIDTNFFFNEEVNQPINYQPENYQSANPDVIITNLSEKLKGIPTTYPEQFFGKGNQSENYQSENYQQANPDVIISNLSEKSKGIPITYSEQFFEKATQPENYQLENYHLANPDVIITNLNEKPKDISTTYLEQFSGKTNQPENYQPKNYHLANPDVIITNQSKKPKDIPTTYSRPFSKKANQSENYQPENYYLANPDVNITNLSEKPKNISTTYSRPFSKKANQLENYQPENYQLTNPDVIITNLDKKHKGISTTYTGQFSEKANQPENYQPANPDVITNLSEKPKGIPTTYSGQFSGARVPNLYELTGANAESNDNANVVDDAANVGDRDVKPVKEDPITGSDGYNGETSNATILGGYESHGSHGISDPRSGKFKGQDGGLSSENSNANANAGSISGSSGTVFERSGSYGGYGESSIDQNNRLNLDGHGSGIFEHNGSSELNLDEHGSTTANANANANAGSSDNLGEYGNGIKELGLKHERYDGHGGISSGIVVGGSTVDAFSTSIASNGGQTNSDALFNMQMHCNCKLASANSFSKSSAYTNKSGSANANIHESSNASSGSPVGVGSNNSALNHEPLVKYCDTVVIKTPAERST